MKAVDGKEIPVTLHRLRGQINKKKGKCLRDPIILRLDVKKSKLHRYTVQAGFAIGSSGSPHNVRASDQIRITWVIAAQI